MVFIISVTKTTLKDYEVIVMMRSSLNFGKGDVSFVSGYTHIGSLKSDWKVM